jgi:hypothetical protein
MALPLMIIVEDSSTQLSARYAFNRSPVRLGRREDNDISLPYPFVSARHGVIQFDEGEIRYTDLGSLNGSLLDGAPLTGDTPVLLEPGAELRIGTLRISFAFGSGARAFTGPTAPLIKSPIRPGALTALMAELARTPEFDAAEAWAGSLHPGLVIGRFELLRELGRGGFGVVYEARDRQLGRLVAFKALRPREHSPASVREDWLQREADAAAQLNHPNIVTLFDMGTWEGGPYLILELLRGETLEVRLGRGPVPFDEAMQVAIDVARALAHAHGAGVIHRDLKPSNVFLTEGGWAKVLDFGLAQVFGADLPSRGGTPRYMSPEQRASATQDGRTDVFSAALMLAETLLGRQLAGPDLAACALASPIRGAPAALSQILALALEEDPALRPADGSHWLAALLAVQRKARASLGE